MDDGGKYRISVFFFFKLYFTIYTIENTQYKFNVIFIVNSMWNETIAYFLYLFILIKVLTHLNIKHKKWQIIIFLRLLRIKKVLKLSIFFCSSKNTLYVYICIYNFNKKIFYLQYVHKTIFFISIFSLLMDIIKKRKSFWFKIRVRKIHLNSNINYKKKKKTISWINWI